MNLASMKVRNVNVNQLAGVNAGYDLMLAAAARPPADLAGIVYYVNKDGGSDNFDGLSPDEPFDTWDKAIDVSMARISWSGSPWANNDEIILFPGKYAENITNGWYGIRTRGLGWHHDINGEAGVTIDPASGSAVDVTSLINGTIENICFEAPDTTVIFQADNFNRMRLIDCTFQGLPGASPTTTRGFEIVKDMTGSAILRCWFKQIKSSIFLTADNANSKQITGDLFEDLWITGGDVAGIVFHVNSTPSMSMVNRCNMDGGGSTLALGLDDNSTSELVHCYNTNFEATACDPASGAGHYNNCYLNGVLMT